MNKQTRQQRYREITPELQNLYADPETGRMQRELFNSLGLEERLYDEFIHIFGDIILGLARPEDLRSLVAGRLLTEEPLTSRVVSEIQRVLLPLLPSYRGAGVPQTKPPTQNPISQTPDSVPVAQSQEAPVVGYANAARPSTDAQVSPSVPSYRRPLTDAPRYEGGGEQPHQSA